MSRRWSVAFMTAALIHLGAFLGALEHEGAAVALVLVVVLFLAAVLAHPGTDA